MLSRIRATSGISRHQRVLCTLPEICGAKPPHAVLNTLGAQSVLDFDLSFHVLYQQRRKEKNMENQITCPRCKKTISDNLLVDSAAAGEGQSTDSYVCECGERISFWAATAQLRDQKKLSRRISNWFRGIFKGRG